MRLKDQERVEAEHLILQAIEKDIDADRPIRAAGHLKLKSASQPLRRRLGSPMDNRRQYNRVQAAWALYQIEQYPEAAELIIGVRQAKPPNGEWSRRIAVQALADFPDSLLVVNALFDALLDDGIASLATLSLKRLFESDHQIRDALNDILLLQYGHKGAGMETDIQVVRERARSLVMRQFAHSVTRGSAT